MSDIWMLIILALAVSFDGFGVGVTYGIRNIRIPLLSIVIIGFCSGCFIWLTMQLGHLFLPYLSERMAEGIGAFILITIGLWTLLQTLFQKEKETRQPASDTATTKTQPKTVLHLEIRRLGLVIDILKTPSKADVDRSGTISAAEAFLLGAALSLDALGAGVGAALVGLVAWLTALVISIACILFIICGLQFGYGFASRQWMKRVAIFPGILLIIMGMVKLM